MARRLISRIWTRFVRFRISATEFRAHIRLIEFRSGPGRPPCSTSGGELPTPDTEGRWSEAQAVVGQTLAGTDLAELGFGHISGPPAPIGRGGAE